MENNEHTFAMDAALKFPRLLLCKTKSNPDEFLSITIARRLKHLQDGELDDLINKKKTLQKHPTKGN